VLYLRLKGVDGDILGATPGGGQSGGPFHETGAMRESGDVRPLDLESEVWAAVNLSPLECPRRPDSL
jgi:hypothetical protein